MFLMKHLVVPGVIVHCIITPAGQVVQEKWRRIPYHRYHLIQTEIAKMLEQGIIQVPEPMV